MAKVEQICRHRYAHMDRPGIGKWYKARTNRIMRKQAKKDPENAPVKRPIRGWSD